jgi:hypothetical protein
MFFKVFVDRKRASCLWLMRWGSRFHRSRVSTESVGGFFFAVQCAVRSRPCPEICRCLTAFGAELEDLDWDVDQGGVFWSFFLVSGLGVGG